MQSRMRPLGDLRQVILFTSTPQLQYGIILPLEGCRKNCIQLIRMKQLAHSERPIPIHYCNKIITDHFLIIPHTTATFL